MNTPRDPERLEQIVSYLDGELSAEEGARVEQRLASDEGFRQELQSIDRAWAALDSLPLATVEDRFAKTTMEMVVQTARSEVDQKTRALPIQKRKRSLANILLIASAALLGGLVFRVGWHNPNRFLFADLPVIQYIDAYSQFRDVDFLRQLNPERKEDFWPTNSEDLAQEVQQLALVSSHETRRAWLEDIAEDERITLRAKFNQFRSLSEDRQERLRHLHEEIAAAEDAEQLRRTMLQYQQWLNNLPASEQYELRELPLGERANRVEKMLRQNAANKSLDLSPEELKALFNAIKPHLEEKKTEILDQMPRRERGHFDSMPGNEKRFFLFRELMMEFPRDSEPLRLAIQNSIPDEKFQAFQKLAPREKQQRFLGWMREAVMLDDTKGSRAGRRVHGEIPEQELEKYFTEELDAASIERLLALPRDKMQRQLERKYRGGVSQIDLEQFFDRDHRPPPWHGPRGRRSGEPNHRPRPHDRHEDGAFPPDRRHPRRPPAELGEADPN